MSNISKRRREGSRAKIKSMGDHKDFLKRITKTLYYGHLPSLPCLSLPVTDVSCEVWSEWQRGRSVRRLHADAAARISRHACVSPAALVLALLYMERLRTRAPDYLSATAPADLFLITLMVGNKFLQDDGEDEEVICSEWAHSGGLDTAYLKRLELDFLNAIDWNVFVNEESFDRGLRWLERRVALRQAGARGFFTYGDLAAADASLAAARDAVLAAARCLATLLALVTSALVVTAACATNTPATTSPAPATPVDTIPQTFPPPLSPTQYVPNSTVELTLEPPTFTDRPACCTEWARYREETIPKRNWFDSLSTTDWKWPEPWWSRTVLNWLYQSSLIDPMQRWLERINEYAELLKQDLYAEESTDKCKYYDRVVSQRCVHQWLNLSKLSAFVVSVSDR